MLFEIQSLIDENFSMSDQFLKICCRDRNFIDRKFLLSLSAASSHFPPGKQLRSCHRLVFVEYILVDQTVNAKFKLIPHKLTQLHVPGVKDLSQGAMI